MNKKCPFGKCEKCVWYRPWEYTERDEHGGLTGKIKRMDKCSLEVMLDYIPRIQGAIDGLQQGVNESRNRSMETKARVEEFGNAVYNVVKNIEESTSRIATNIKLLGK